MTRDEAVQLCSRVVNACTNVDECGNQARPGKSLCHACEKRRQRNSRNRRPHFHSPWERLVATALRYSAADSDAEYARAEAALRSAALHYARHHPAPSLHASEACPPAG